jgi:hypothetical protein
MTDKTTELAIKIAEVLKPHIDTQLAPLMVQLGVVTVRLTAIEAALASGDKAVAPKKVVRTAAMAAAGGAAVAASAKPAKKAGTPNSLLYFRNQCAENITFRNRYLTEALINLHKTGTSVVKQTEGTPKYFSAIAADVWKTFTEEQKKEIKALRESEEEAKQTTASAPLQEEGSDDE